MNKKVSTKLRKLAESQFANFGGDITVDQQYKALKAAWNKLPRNERDDFYNLLAYANKLKQTNTEII